MPRYVPEPVPDFLDDTQELRRYLFQELDRLSESVNQKVDRSYGGILQDVGVFIFSPLTPTPELFDPFDFATPARPDGVLPIPAGGTLVPLSSGAYLFQFHTTVINIPPNAEYGFLLAKNGISTGLGGVVNPSNQTETADVNFNILDNSLKGDVYTILINSPSSTDCQVTGSEFNTNRVSEEQ